DKDLVGVDKGAPSNPLDEHYQTKKDEYQVRVLVSSSLDAANEELDVIDIHVKKEKDEGDIHGHVTDKDDDKKDMKGTKVEAVDEEGEVVAEAEAGR
ncbi:hypothetical protein ACFL0V_01885, partial [Nanoarchaeota archaeon]